MFASLNKGIIMTDQEIQKAFQGDQQGYLFADLVRIINQGCVEPITDQHIQALLEENRYQIEANERTENDFPF